MESLLYSSPQHVLQMRTRGLGVLSIGVLTASAACRACLALNSADALSADCDVADDGLSNDSCPGG